MPETRVQRLFLQAVQAYQQSGVDAGRRTHDALRQVAAGSLYDIILTGLADAVEGRWEEALAAYNQALDVGPDSFKLVFVLKSDVLERLHRYDEAVATLDAGIAQAPSNLILYEIKAVFLVEIGRLSDVIGVYDALLHRRPHSVETLVCKSLAFFLLGQTEQAWWVQRQVFSCLLDPSKLPVFQENWHTHLGQYTQLVDAYQRDHPTQADGWYWKGLIQVIDHEPSGPFDEALDAFGRAIEADAVHAWAWNGKGMVLMAQCRYREAATAFAQAVSLLPTVEGFIRNRRKASRAVEGEVSSRPAAPSHVAHRPGAGLPRFSPLEIPPIEVLERLLHEERFDDALQICDQLLSVARLLPGRVNGKAALRLKARLLYDLHRTDEAIAISREILRCDPADPQARDDFVSLLIETRRFLEALEMLSPTSADDEQDASLFERRAGVCLLLRRYQEAWEAATRAHALDPGRLSISLIQIEALHHLGNIPKALLLCEETLHTAQRSARVFPMLLASHAHLVLEAGRPREALTIYEEALRREQEQRTRPLDDAGVVLEGFGAFHGDAIAILSGGMGNAWLSLGESAKALACYDQALSFGPDDGYQKNRDLALALLFGETDRTPARSTEGGSNTPSTPASTVAVERGWPLVPWRAVLTRLRAWLLRPGQ
ncbi:MAG: tetratricopeptide repeat protein [Ktedonobacteraceae bacterium]